MDYSRVFSVSVLPHLVLCAALLAATSSSANEAAGECDPAPEEILALPEVVRLSQGLGGVDNAAIVPVPGGGHLAFVWAEDHRHVLALDARGRMLDAESRSLERAWTAIDPDQLCLNVNDPLFVQEEGAVRLSGTECRFSLRPVPTVKKTREPELPSAPELEPLPESSAVAARFFASPGLAKVLPKATVTSCAAKVPGTAALMVYVASDRRPLPSSRLFVFDPSRGRIDRKNTSAVLEIAEDVAGECQGLGSFSGMRASEEGVEVGFAYYPGTMHLNCAFVVRSEGNSLRAEARRACDSGLGAMQTVSRKIDEAHARGKALWESGKKAEATAAWLSAWERHRGCNISERFGELCNDAGFGLLETGKVQRAREVLRACEKDAPDRAVLQLNLGDAERRLGNVAEALRHYRRVLELSPEPATRARAEKWIGSLEPAR